MTTLALTNFCMTRNKQVLCDSLNLTIQPGDFWGILGANGCGKTTLLHSLSGQLAPTQGYILLNEQPLTTFTTREIAKHIGILFQDSHFAFPQTVHEYCQDARFAHHNWLIQSNHEATISPVLRELNLDQIAHRYMQQLSGGQQRRAALAALFIQQPDIYLLDEPTNHLDLSHQVLIMNKLKNLSMEHAVVMSSHDINLAARYCNKMLLLMPDGLIMHGDSHEMLTSTNLSKVYQHPIDAISHNDHTYWLPQQVNAANLSSTQ